MLSKSPALLVLWNIDATLVDVAQITREVCAAAFERVTGRPLVRLASMAGRTESEIFFETLALNDVPCGDDMLAEYTTQVGAEFEARAGVINQRGRPMPGAAQALAELARRGDVVQSVLTGADRRASLVKLHAFRLDMFVDVEIGGYGSEPYPKGTLLQVARSRAEQRHQVEFGEQATVYVGDSPRDVAAARIGGAVAVAVAGGTATVSQLRDAGADVVFEDLTNTPQVVEALRAHALPRG